MDFPKDLFYTQDHEWLSSKKDTVEIGVSSFAIEQLGDIVHVELPEVGEEFERGDAFGTIESTKTVSDLYMPAKGRVVEINQSLEDKPENVQEDPYGNGWLIKVELTEETESVMTYAEYEKFIQE